MVRSPGGGDRLRTMKGWRSITVNGYELRWLFFSTTGVIKIRGLSNSGQSAEIELKGWEDPWVNLAQTDPHGSSPVTPKLVSEAAKFALQSGWDPASRAKPTKLVFERTRVE